MKQYVITPAYTDNLYITRIVDGRIVGTAIQSYYNLTGYVEALEEDGYEVAYDVSTAKFNVHMAQEELKIAKLELKEAIKHPVNFSEGEYTKFKRMVGYDD